MRLRIWQTIRRCQMAVMSKENVRRHGNGYAVVRGKHPRAKGKLGDILAFAREAVNGPKIEHLSLCVIDGKERLPDTWYDDNFEECEAV